MTDASPSTRLRLLEAQIADLRPRPLAKCRDPREQAAEEWDEDVRASLRALLDSGQFGLRELARELECSAPYLHDVRTGARAVPKWMAKSLPRAGRAELAARLIRGDSSVPPSRTGTD